MHTARAPTLDDLTYVVVACACIVVGAHTVSVSCDGAPLIGSPFVAKAFNTSAIQLTGMPAVGVIRCPVEFTGETHTTVRSDVTVERLESAERVFCYNRLTRIYSMNQA